MTGSNYKMPRVLCVGLKTCTKITMIAYVVILAFDEWQLGWFYWFWTDCVTKDMNAKQTYKQCRRQLCTA